MYADYSTDVDTSRKATSTPPTAISSSSPPLPSSYPPRPSQSANAIPVNATYSPSLKSQSLASHSMPSHSSPQGLADFLNSESPRASPRPSGEDGLGSEVPQPHLPVHQRRQSFSSSGASEHQITTRYEPVAELGPLPMDDGAPTGFDEGILRALCELDCGVPLLLDRIKQSMISCREISMFFKKRAVVEDEYGRTLQKVARGSNEAYAMNDGKAGSFVSSWRSTLKLHDVIGENRLRFAARLNEMSEELASLAKEVEKNRKATKDLATRYERGLQESEQQLEKAKQRFEATHEELERILLAKEGESIKEAGSHTRAPAPAGKRVIGKAVAKGGMLLKGKNPQSIIKQEEDVRARMSAYSDAFRKAVLETQTMRQEYFNFQLPRILRSLKECADEIDLGTQYHLSRYAFMFETTVLKDGTTLVPSKEIEDGPGLKPLIESIDNRADFKSYMQNYAIANNRPSGPRREGPWEEGFLPPLPRHHDIDPLAAIPNAGPRASISTQGGVPYTNGTPQHSTNGHSAPSPNIPPAIVAAMAAYPDRGHPTFGVDLTEQMARDGVEYPRILERCCDAIEATGLRSQGIYRISGTASKVQKLKVILDRDVEGVDLLSDEWKVDVNVVTGVLKLWLRELPEPLLTFALYQGYIDAAKIPNDRYRHIQLHHRVNDLPDANYATLKYLMGHLHKIRELESVNSMSATNLSIVFGPTLLGPPPASMFGDDAQAGGGGGGGTTLQDMNWQCKAIETIIEHYTDIFVDEAEAEPTATTAPAA